MPAERNLRRVRGASVRSGRRIRLRRRASHQLGPGRAPHRPTKHATPWRPPTAATSSSRSRLPTETACPSTTADTPIPASSLTEVGMDNARSRDRLVDDRHREYVHGHLIRGCRQAEHPVDGPTRRNGDIRAVRAARGERAGFVQHQSACTTNVSSAPPRGSALRYATPGQPGHNRHGCGQQQRTGCGHDQYRDGADRCAADNPGQSGDCQCQRKEPGGHAIGDPHNRGRLCGGLRANRTIPA